MSAMSEDEDFEYTSLEEECFGDKATADLLRDPDVHPDAKKFFAGRVAAHHELHGRNEKPVVVNKNSPFYNPANAERYPDERLEPDRIGDIEFADLSGLSVSGSDRTEVVALPAPDNDTEAGRPVSEQGTSPRLKQSGET